jgi:uncharacterized protein (TIGR03435 family)
MKGILVRAYGVPPEQIRGPSWLDSVTGPFFDIAATMPVETTKEQFQLMLQDLLALRFHLALHHETAEFPGYDLVVAAGGPKFKPWNPGSEAAPAGGRGRGANDAEGFPILPPGVHYLSAGSAPRNGVITPHSTHQETMIDFCKRLGAMINKSNGAPYGAATPRVEDETGLAGVYEFRLWYAGILALPADLAASPNAVPTQASDPGAYGPSLFTALEQQLGLKLVRAKNVPVDVFVVDKLDKIPTEN